MASSTTVGAATLLRLTYFRYSSLSVRELITQLGELDKLVEWGDAASGRKLHIETLKNLESGPALRPRVRLQVSRSRYRIASLSYNSPLIITLASSTSGAFMAVTSAWLRINQLRRDHAFTRTQLLEEAYRQQTQAILQEELQRLREWTPDDNRLEQLSHLSRAASLATTRIDSLELNSPSD